MVSDRDQACSSATPEYDAGLRVALESHLPASLPVGRATAIFCYGHCFCRHEALSHLELVIGGSRHRPDAMHMPRPDLFEWLTGPHGDGQDPEGRSYRSGFWSTVPIAPQWEAGMLELQAAVRLASGVELIASLGLIEIVARSGGGLSRAPLPSGTIAICMATFDPEISLFAAQIQSLHAQTYEQWVCVISDGGTSDERFKQLLGVAGGDPRFAVSRSPQRLDPYRNFERALRLAPADAELIALCDQDDRWYPEKLAVLREALGATGLVYSDQRLISDDGRVVRSSLWQGRHNDWTNLGSLLVANTMPGAAMLFRRELAEVALPFPDAPGVQYHDHWLALVALASGDVAYVDRPLYDYVQHSRAVSGDVSGGPASTPAPRHRRWPPALRRRRSRSACGSRGWRGAYFGGYVPRQVLAHTLLLRCAGAIAPPKRRALQLFAAADRAPIPFLWLATRPLRRLVGRDETLGGETALVRGILWRWLIVLAVGRSQSPGRHVLDASFPDPPRFEQRRLRRWRAGS